ncbi:MAG: hypothetical protein QXO98_00865 [Sulfolobales archaeon]
MNSVLYNDIKQLFNKLLTNYVIFFSKDGVLNSEGRKLFELIARNIIRENPERKKLIVKIRKNPTLENIVKLATLYMDDDYINYLIRDAFTQ